MTKEKILESIQSFVGAGDSLMHSISELNNSIIIIGPVRNHSYCLAIQKDYLSWAENIYNISKDYGMSDCERNI